MEKRGLLIFILLIGILVLISGIVIAQENISKGEELECLPCGDNCAPAEDVAAMMCEPPTGTFECGVQDGKCVTLNFKKFEDDFENNPELENCVKLCKLNFEDEEPRSKCIGGCKADFGDEKEFQTDWDGSCGDFDCDELEISGGGITPDSAFYFLDKFFDGFGDKLKVKEEKIAEIKLMIEEGNYEAAREALEIYKEQVEELEKEIGPDQKEEAMRSAEAIKKVLRELENEIPEDDKDDFVDDIIESENSIATAAEIANKIRELCEQLSELNPSEYYSVCRSDDDSPDWQKKLDKKLTKEQREEAEKFGKIMEQCFKTSGQDCKCEEIPYSDFADACSTAAPLATACDIEGDEAACDKLDNLDMPRLPPHLEDIMDVLESRMMDSKFELHMPPECIEAGVTNPRDCGKIMIETHAPEECRQALLESGCESEFECRDICDEIMMKKHAPECVEKGITDPEECRDFMDDFRGPDGPMEGGPRINFNCREIDDPIERLDCYDKASSQASSYRGFDDENYDGPCMTESDWRAKKEECRGLFGEHAGDEPIMGDSGEGYECVVDAKCIDFGQGKMDFEEIKERERECAESCEREGGRWDFSYGECKCYKDDYEDSYPPGEDDYNGPGCDDCSSQCEERPGQRLRGTDCINGRCECYYESDEPDYGPGEGPGEPGEYEGEPPSDFGGSGSGGSELGNEGGIETGNEGDNGVQTSPEPEESGSDGGSGESEPSSDDGGSSEPSSDSGGDVGITGNVFLDYWYS